MGTGFSHLFSERANSMKASEIRELLKLTQRSEIISFAGGLPSPEAFPVEEVRKICGDILRKKGKVALQYGATEGVASLRKAIASRMIKRGINCNFEDVLITSGSQQGLDLVSKIFLDPRDTVIVGAPTYLGGTNAFNAFQAKMETVPVNDEGMDLDALKKKLNIISKRGRNAVFLYIIPTFQNPAGVTMPEKKRKELMEIASSYDLLIVEDDPYSELRYEGKATKPLKALDKEGRVIYLGTFSKILSPGFRCAWLIAHPEIFNKLVIAKQSTDLCTNTFTQYIASEYLTRGLVDSHIEKIKRMYKEKRNTMFKAMERYFPKGLKWTQPHGGMFLWVTLPEGIDTRVMFEDAVRNNVAYVIGSAFYADDGGKNAMRLNFTYPSNDEIKEGIKRLADVIKKELEKEKRELVIGV